jgi:hypothetical protein
MIVDALFASQMSVWGGLVESEADTLRFQTAQTKKTVDPKPFPDAESSVAAVVVVTGRFNGKEAASSVDVKWGQLMLSDRSAISSSGESCAASLRYIYA